MSELIRKLKEKKYITKIKIKDDISDELISKEIPQVGSVKIVAAVKEEIGPVRPPYAVMRETNPELMDVCVANGWAANEDYMTYEEAAAITDEMIEPIEYTVYYTEYCSKFIILNDMSNPTYSSIKVAPKSLDEFQYFTSITKSPLSLISKSDGECKTIAPVTKITFPENITKIADISGGRGQAAKYYLTEIKFLSQTPPTYYAVGDNSNSMYALKSGCANSGIIYVPKGSKEDYMKKDYILALTNSNWTIEEF